MYPITAYRKAKVKNFEWFQSKENQLATDAKS